MYYTMHIFEQILLMNTDIRPGKINLHFMVIAHMVFEEPADIIYKIRKVFTFCNLLSIYNAGA